MKVVFGQKYPAAVFCDERMCVRELAARVIQLEPISGGHPDSRNAVMIERSRELIKTGYDVPMRRNKVVNGHVQNEGSLAQAALRGACSILTEISSWTNI